MPLLPPSRFSVPHSLLTLPLHPFPTRSTPRPTPSRNLRRHEKLHTSKKSFVCTEEGCGAAFHRRSDLATHRKGAHLGIKPFVCDMPGCGAAFTRSSDFRVRPAGGQARASRRPVRAPPHQARGPCSCFAPRHPLRLSAPVSHPYAPQLHQRRHAKIKPHACALCTKSYLRRCELAGHMSRVHGDALSSRSSTPSEPVASSAATAAGPAALVPMPVEETKFRPAPAPAPAAPALAPALAGPTYTGARPTTSSPPAKQRPCCGSGLTAPPDQTRAQRQLNGIALLTSAVAQDAATTTQCPYSDCACGVGCTCVECPW